MWHIFFYTVACFGLKLVICLLLFAKEHLEALAVDPTVDPARPVDTACSTNEKRKNLKSKHQFIFILRILEFQSPMLLPFTVLRETATWRTASLVKFRHPKSSSLLKCCIATPNKTFKINYIYFKIQIIYIWIEWWYIQLNITENRKINQDLKCNWNANCHEEKKKASAERHFIWNSFPKIYLHQCQTKGRSNFIWFLFNLLRLVHLDY